MNILKKIRNGITYFDGGAGTLLQSWGLEAGEYPESWNISKPEKIIEMHRLYLEAGADIITSCTFGANRFKFENLDFVELNACDGGCVGGVSTLENPYIARTKLRKLRKYMPVSRNRLEKSIPTNMLWDKHLEYVPVFEMEGTRMEKRVKPKNYQDKEYFRQVRDSAIAICTYLCIQYNLKANSITTHCEGYQRYGSKYASNHSDIHHWWKMYQNYTISDFRNDVAKNIELRKKGMEFKSGKEALDFLVSKGRVNNKDYWEKVLVTTRNIEFLLIKWAEDYSKSLALYPENLE